MGLSLIGWGKKHCDAQDKRMRIAALQYANGQVKHCDDYIESPQCFLGLHGNFMFNKITI